MLLNRVQDQLHRLFTFSMRELNVISYWRERLLYISLTFFFIFNLLYFVLCFRNLHGAYLRTWLAVSAFLYLVLLLLSLLKVLSFRTRSRIMLGILFVSSALFFYAAGFESPGVYLLLGFQIISALFLEPRGVVLTLTLAVILLVGFGYATVTWGGPWVANPEDCLRTWTSLSVSLIAFGILITGMVLILIANVARALRREGNAVDDLNRERRMLLETNVKLREEMEVRQQTEDERALLQDQLQQAQKMEVVGRLAGGIAHDFNNLLTAIGGNAYLGLMSVEKDDFLYHQFKQISQTTEHAARLIGKLLAFSKKQIVAPEVLRINHVLDSIGSMMKSVIGDTVNLKLELEKDLWNIEIDPIQLEQVIMNLLVNARDAIKPTGRIDLKTENLVLSIDDACKILNCQPGDYVCLSIADDGHGISDEVLKHIFDPFFTTKESGKGTGLGLATVYGIVEQVGGIIRVESRIGEGTVFKVYFPRANARARETSVSEHELDDVRGTERILVVEDEPAVLESIVNILEYFGYTVVEAQSGKDALEILKDKPERFDLVLSDVDMPGMTGPEVVENILRLQPDQKVLFMSGYTEGAIVDKGVLKPGIPYIHKPFQPLALGNRIREVLDGIR